MNRFDRFADWCADTIASTKFFIFAIIIVLVWLLTFPLFKSVDTWQLVINAVLNILSWLALVLLHNTQHRFETATNKRLRTIEERGHELRDPVEDEGQK
jgi:low affinity Fe/Cu permease